MNYMGYVKNVLIVLLVVLSIYQANKVWDVGGSSTLNFSSVNQPIVNSDIGKKVVLPTMIYKYNNYSDNFTGVFFDDYDKNYCAEYLYGVLKDYGKKNDTRYFTKNDLDNCVIAFEYEINIDYNTLFDVLYDDTTEENFAFDVVYVCKENENYLINFVEKNTNMLNQFIVSGREVLPTAVNNEILSGVSYTTTMNTYGAHTNDFVLDIDKNTRSFSDIYATNPYYIDKELLLSDLQNKTKSFFNDGDKTWSRIDKDSFIFSSDNVIIKYFSNDMLDVSYYKSGTSKTTSIKDAYAIAHSFIENDIYVTNKFYLQYYEQEENKCTFYFNYYIENVPISVPEGSEQNSHIKIVVENNSITSYKKLVYNYESLSNYNTLISSTQKKALDDFFNIDNLENMNIKLVYTFLNNNVTSNSFDDKALNLAWEVKSFQNLEYLPIN